MTEAPPASRGTLTSVELEVPFHDVDTLRVVWHGHYLKYLEIARTALLRKHRLDVQDLIEIGYAFVVIESQCRHSFPLRYGDRFRVSAWFKDVDYRLNVAFEILNLTHDRRVARARTTLATLDDRGQLLYATPDAILERLRAVDRGSS